MFQLFVNSGGTQAGFVCAYVWMCLYVFGYLCICIYVCLCVWGGVKACAWECVCVCVRAYVRARVCTCLYGWLSNKIPISQTMINASIFRFRASVTISSTPTEMGTFFDMTRPICVINEANSRWLGDTCRLSVEEWTRTQWALDIWHVSLLIYL